MSVFHIIIQWLEHRHTWERRPYSFSRTQVHFLSTQKRSHSIWRVQAAAAWALFFLFSMVTFPVMFDVKTKTLRSLGLLLLKSKTCLADLEPRREETHHSYLESNTMSSTLWCKGGWRHLYALKDNAVFSNHWKRWRRFWTVKEQVWLQLWPVAKLWRAVGSQGQPCTTNQLLSKGS